MENKVDLSNLVIIPRMEYKDMLYKCIKADSAWNRMYKIIYDLTLSKQKKYDKLKDILLEK